VVFFCTPWKIPRLNCLPKIDMWEPSPQVLVAMTVFGDEVIRVETWTQRQRENTGTSL
jgi:hypothetical protein